MLVHTEFEASRKEPDFPRRMYRYYCQLFLRHDTEIVRTRCSATALILQLEKKFGKLGTARKRKIRQIESTRELESLLLAVLDAKSLKDLPL